ncbi:hypothetical protein N7532_003867 [Penicillium argentinense]|uniref:Calcineurin-like phosphoesterase domain-containing protein n=1 Tax=Penicillium argentinense TaxID=1131581 RepID=A0A9W9FNE9_9EURO|nr:uncharacterized protein N7532_003867 [Penicillium argentinense]KAJ5103338.1 hypothetical protein N7532_003867 [Penicillium argentinense]
MFPRSLLARIFALLLPLTLSATVYLYLYPVFNGCAFPIPRSASSKTENQTILKTLLQNAATNTFLQHLGITDPSADTQPAIFRLLVLADPQLEGDTSLPLPEWKLAARARKHWKAVEDAVGNVPADTSLPMSLLNQNVLSNITTGIWTLTTEDIPRSLRAVQKQIDLLGNDYYLAHIYRTLFWWTLPTHTTVLGDLLGSQWIDDDEFNWRSQRYWTRVLSGGQRVDDHITRTGAVEGDAAEKQELEPLGPNSDPAWARRVINIAGNHDIGYAGDASEARIERFEREFGRANWDVRFQHPPIVLGGNQSEVSSDKSTITPTLHLINLNTLILDTPALSEAAQSHCYNYLNDLISKRLYPVEDRSTFTLLLTHLPLHKEDGVCTDGPYFTFHDDEDDDGPDGVPRWKKGGLREQNHLSDFLSASGILQGIFGMSGDENAPAGGTGRKGLVLTGHDHTGCDTVHYVDHNPDVSEDGESGDKASDNTPSQSWKWTATRYNESFVQPETPSIREVTLRSMMGDFGGNAGLLSIWFDVDLGEWDYEIMMCPAGVQHIWWAVHVLILITIIVGFLWMVVTVADPGAEPAKETVQDVPKPIKERVRGHPSGSKYRRSKKPEGPVE